MTADTSKRLLWQDGELVTPEEAKISILSPTCMYGLNVFETVRGYVLDDDKVAIFRANDHIDRLIQSCRIMDLDLPLSSDEVFDAMMTTLRACNFSADLSARIVVYVDNHGSWSSTEDCKLLIAPILKERTYKSDITCCVSSWERINDNSLPPRAKVGANYVSGRLPQLEAKRHGYDTPLLLNAKGTVSEAPGACFFMVRDGMLVTPPQHASILESITRSSVMTMARDQGIDLDVREIDRTELYCAEEAFICGTAVEVTPISKIDHCALRTGNDAPITQSITEAYFDIVRGRKSLYSEWLSLV